MNIINRIFMDLKEKAQLENTKAKAEEMKSVQDYNIMMGNLEDPNEEEETDE